MCRVLFLVMMIWYLMDGLELMDGVSRYTVSELFELLIKLAIES